MIRFQPERHAITIWTVLQSTRVTSSRLYFTATSEELAQGTE